MEFLAILLIVVVSFTSSLASTIIPQNFTIAKPNCPDRCGNVRIPFPFGLTKDCYHHYSFWVTCNQTKAFMQNSTVEITDISLDGQLRLLQFISHDCYNRSHTRVRYNDPQISLPYFITFNNTANKFTVVGCDTYGFVFGFLRSGRDYKTGCTATCNVKDDLMNGSCTGLGCCQTSFPKQVWKVQLEMQSFDKYGNVSDFNNCGHAFVVEESAFTFSPDNLTNLRGVEKLPMVADWAIGNGTCEKALINSTDYACKSANSRCYDPDNGLGYRCSCVQGYQGNPYLVDGCQDIDECADPSLNICEKHCVNELGGFNCICPKGYHGDGRKGGQGCIRGESLVFKLVAGILLGVIVLLLSSCWLYLTLQRRSLIKMRQQYFRQNGGLLLQEKLRGREGSPDMAKIFSESELNKATDNFHSSMIIGQGGYGIVYKGFILPDNRVVAIKKAKEVPKQIDQFTNEVIVLSQINHRNVDKLLGCCLETQIPLLVYEFISNGTLYEHIHNKAKARTLSWDMRLSIATETASVLSYLHSSASTPIVHRDVKSANILLDHTFTAKVSDFGASRLFPLDQTQVTTLIQGTFGYMDPEYMQTHQLTQKSDVYSFGVVLVELLTGRKAVSNDVPEEERSLANFFLSVMKEEHLLFRILEDNVAREGTKEVVMKVAVLAKRCLNVKGDRRPSMKEVERELDGLRDGAKHSWIETEDNAQDMESLLRDDGFSSFTSFGDTSTSIGFDSLKDHQTVLPVGGGR